MEQNGSSGRVTPPIKVLGRWTPCLFANDAIHVRISNPCFLGGGGFRTLLWSLSRLERGAETKTIDRVDKLFHTDAVSVKRHPRLLLPEAHLGLLYTLEPFQGPLDRKRSAPSRHPLDGEHHR